MSLTPACWQVKSHRHIVTFTHKHTHTYKFTHTYVYLYVCNCKSILCQRGLITTLPILQPWCKIIISRSECCKIDYFQQYLPPPFVLSGYQCTSITHNFESNCYLFCTELKRYKKKFTMFCVIGSGIWMSANFWKISLCTCAWSRANPDDLPTQRQNTCLLLRTFEATGCLLHTAYLDIEFRHSFRKNIA